MTSVEMPALESSTTGELAAHAPLRIVHVTTTAVGGGAAKVMLDLASAQRAAGHEVLAISILPRTPPPAWFGPEHGQWSDVCHLEWFLRYDRPSNLWEARRRLRRELDRFRPDIVHSHLWVADIVTSLAVDRRSSQHLVHLHCRDTWKDSSAWKHRFRRAMTRQLFRRAHTRMIACSETVKEFEVRRMGWPADFANFAECNFHFCDISEICGRIDF